MSTAPTLHDCKYASTSGRGLHPAEGHEACGSLGIVMNKVSRTNVLNALLPSHEGFYAPKDPLLMFLVSDLDKQIITISKQGAHENLRWLACTDMIEMQREERLEVQ